MKLRLFALAATAAAALAQGATGSARPQTTAPPPVVDIKVTITDRAITMRPKKAFRGDYARFILVNTGNKPHTFSFGAKKRGAGVQTGFVKPLKPKEQKILLLVAEGKTNKAIAAEIFLSDKTVKNYVSSILSKLNLERRAQAAAFVARHRIGRPPD